MASRRSNSAFLLFGISGRLCLRCGPDGAQSRAGARPARACPGAFGLGRHRDPQADRISDPRKAEAGARSGRLVAGAGAEGPDIPRQYRGCARLSRRVEPVLRRSPCAVTVVPTKSFDTVGGIVEINLIALTNGAARKKQ